MAISIARVVSYSVGDRRHIALDITCDNSYVTGGYPLTATQLGVDVTPTTYGVNFNQGQGGFIFNYDYTNSKMKIYSIALAAEVANAFNLSAVTVRTMVWGKSVSNPG